MNWRAKAPDLAVAGVVSAFYLEACCSVVVRKYGFWDLPVPGLCCLLWGWGDYPFGWLANPLLLVGVILIASGRRRAGSMLGVMAIVPLTYWSLDWKNYQQWRMISTGYFFWAASIVLLAIGGFAIQMLRTRREASSPSVDTVGTNAIFESAGH
jgi:O-antigen ligase